MSLFPAYSSSTAAPPPPGETVFNNDPEDINDPTEACASPVSEMILLETSSESSVDDGRSDRKRKNDNSEDEPPTKKKKKHKRRHKETEKKANSREDKVPIFDTDEFYLDKKFDRGNLYVSTLYYPGRPEYRQSKRCIGYFLTDDKIKKRRQKRYFEVDIRFMNEKNNEDESNGNEHKSIGDFEKIADSKQKWDDSRTEKELTEKTTQFNKYLTENPYDVDMWLQFVKFQEDRYTFEVLSYRTTSESGAQESCRQKQLSIIETALKHNPKNTELLDAKLNLSRLSMPAQDYLTMVKELIATETEGPVCMRLWCALTEGVSGSAALCSAGAVRETHAAAATTLRRDQGAYLELFYRYGLFLRQAGLLEQLFLLMDLITAMNFASRSDAFQLKKVEAMQRETRLANEEVKLMSSGLPLSVVWTRLESARAAVHWSTELPPQGSGEERNADPQRWPEPADVADMLAPLTQPSHLFTLTVHILRLARVPLLPHDGCSGSLLRALHPQMGGPPAWEVDSVESLIPLLVEMPRPPDMRHVLARHLVRPHFFDNIDGYLTFVEDLFSACVDWMSGRTRLALLLWWIRFQAALLSFASDNRLEAVRVRKSLQRVLKVHAESPLAFAEFARVEAVACGPERAKSVAVAAMRSAGDASRAHRLAIARCVCNVDQVAGGWALACAALGRSLPTDVTKAPTAEILLDALTECERRCNELYIQATEDFEPVYPLDCMLPSDDTEWWSCRYQIYARLHPNASLIQQHRKLEQMFRDAKTPRALRMHEAASASLIQFAGRDAPILARISLIKQPHCARLAVIAGIRPTVLTRPPPPPPSSVAVLASLLPLLQNVDGGVGRRVLAGLRRACSGEGARCPLVWRLRLDAEARLPGGNARSALYLALDACPQAKALYVEGVSAAPGEFSELTDLLLEKQLRLHALPEELEPV